VVRYTDNVFYTQSLFTFKANVSDIESYQAITVSIEFKTSISYTDSAFYEIILFRFSSKVSITDTTASALGSYEFKANVMIADTTGSALNIISLSSMITYTDTPYLTYNNIEFKTVISVNEALEVLNVSFEAVIIYSDKAFIPAKEFELRCDIIYTSYADMQRASIELLSEIGYIDAYYDPSLDDLAYQLAQAQIQQSGFQEPIRTIMFRLLFNFNKIIIHAVHSIFNPIDFIDLLNDLLSDMPSIAPSYKPVLKPHLYTK
jgi:hypothetical protein